MESSEKQEETIKKDAEYKNKQRRINNEIKRLSALFKDIDSRKKRLVKTTIEDVAFMTVTMQDLRKIIAREGTTSKYQNGKNQWGTKQSPESQLYVQLTSKLTPAVKLLNECLQKGDNHITQTSDGFDEFVSNRRDM